MQLISRRVVVATGASLAVGGVARKPVAQTILSPRAEPAVRLLGIEGLQRSDPPAVLEAAGFTDGAGKAVSLADFAGKGVVLNLWATWCVPCVAEMPALDAAAKQLADAGILVVPLSSDRGGAPVVQKFYAARGIRNLGIWLDPRGVAARAFHARGLPTTLIIDRAGRERGRLEGGVDWASAEALELIRVMVAG